LGEPLRSLRSLASGYPLHHLRARPSVGRFGGSATIPLAANAPTKRNKKRILVEYIPNCCILPLLSFFSPKHTLKIMAHGKTIKLFLIDGKADGRTSCELSNWTGKAYRIPRMQIKDSIDRKDIFNTGIYLLFGSDEEVGDQVYIGEAEVVMDRLKQHLKSPEKEFFKEAIVFVSKDNNLNKAHIKYLESRLYEIAKNAKRYKLQNRNTPTQSSISEADEAEMEEFIENIKMLVNAMGHKVFDEKREAVVGTPEQQTQNVFVLKTANTGADASGIPTTDGFVVFKGSKAANKINDSSSPTIKRLRQELIEKGILFLNADVYEFKDDHIFGSPSTAGGIVTGGNVNGLTAWVRKNDGVTLKDAAI